MRHNMLGSTETGSVYLTDPYEGDLPERLRGSFGKPTPGFEVKIVEPETGAEVPVHVPGEIWVRGPYMMEGYVGRERFDVFDRDGWYRFLFLKESQVPLQSTGKLDKRKLLEMFRAS
jgi:acyl-CoA synthetase (AMP-forming)/AMP-acid ligase II